MSDGFIGMIEYVVARAIGDVIVDSIFRYPHCSSFEQKMRCGVTYYRRQKNNYVDDYKGVKFNRRLQTKRVQTHTKK